MSPVVAGRDRLYFLAVRAEYDLAFAAYKIDFVASDFALAEIALSLDSSWHVTVLLRHEESGKLCTRYAASASDVALALLTGSRPGPQIASKIFRDIHSYITHRKPYSREGRQLLAYARLRTP